MVMFPQAACLQMEITTGDVAANLNQCRQLLAEQELAENTVVVLPELWATGFDYPRVEELAAQTPHILSSLQEMAAEQKLWFAGSLLEKRDQGAPGNTLFLVGSKGVVGTYQKQHLFSFWQEDKYLQPGHDAHPIATPFGPLGALVCYDLRFPRISRAQIFAGCRLLVVSAQWPMVRLDHWQLLVKARAVENQIFVAACNGCGPSPAGALAGHSMIVDPVGQVLAQAGSESGVISTGLAEENLERVRSRFCTGGERNRLGNDAAKIVGFESLAEQLDMIRRQGSKVVFTNGCFDLLHAGHVDYLERARRFGDCLVIGLNSDRSVRSLKGDSRPVNKEQDRARVLAAVGCVDFVVIFDEETPLNLITRLLPDVLVKGADWAEGEIAGAAEVKAAGGRVERVVFEHQLSTSAVIQKIRR